MFAVSRPPAPASVPAKSTARKKLVRRSRRDSSQTLRRAFQFVFLVLNLWIGIQFYLFVRYYETGGQTVWVPRPPGVEGWLPIVSLMNLKLWLTTGEVPAVHPAGMFLLLAFLVSSWIFRKGFCSWLCPVGTVSEYLWRLGKHAFRRNFHLPRPVDLSLRGMKYILLALFLYVVGSMPASGLHAFLASPYGLVADVKMLDFFRFLGLTGALVMAVLVFGSLLVQNFWCRYLCPYGALMGLVSMASPLRIRRVPSLCLDCAKCAKACPSSLPVDRLVTIQSAECLGCMACVAECPAEGALMLSAPRKKRVPAWAVACGVALLFLGATAYAKWTGHWRTDVPTQVYFRLIPQASELTHPY